MSILSSELDPFAETAAKWETIEVGESFRLHVPKNINGREPVVLVAGGVSDSKFNPADEVWGVRKGFHKDLSRVFGRDANYCVMEYVGKLGKVKEADAAAVNEELFKSFAGVCKIVRDLRSEYHRVHGEPLKVPTILAAHSFGAGIGWNTIVLSIGGAAMQVQFGHHIDADAILRSDKNLKVIAETFDLIVLSQPALSVDLATRPAKFAAKFFGEHYHGSLRESMRPKAILALLGGNFWAWITGMEGGRNELGRLADKFKLLEILAKLSHNDKSKADPLENVLQDPDFMGKVLAYLPKIVTFLGSGDKTLNSAEIVRILGKGPFRGYFGLEDVVAGFGHSPHQAQSVVRKIQRIAAEIKEEKWPEKQSKLARHWG